MKRMQCADNSNYSNNKQTNELTKDSQVAAVALKVNQHTHTHTYTQVNRYIHAQRCTQGFSCVCVSICVSVCTVLLLNALACLLLTKRACLWLCVCCSFFPCVCVKYNAKLLLMNLQVFIENFYQISCATLASSKSHERYSCHSRVQCSKTHVSSTVLNCWCNM